MSSKSDMARTTRDERTIKRWFSRWWQKQQHKNISRNVQETSVKKQKFHTEKVTSAEILRVSSTVNG